MPVTLSISGRGGEAGVRQRSHQRLDDFVMRSPERSSFEFKSSGDASPNRPKAAKRGPSGLARLSAAGLAAYCSYAIWRTPLLPLYAQDLGAGPSLIGFVMGASTIYGAAHGVFGTIYDVGDALGPIAAGFLVATVGYARMLQTMALVAFAMALVFLIGSRRRPLVAAIVLLGWPITASV